MGNRESARVDQVEPRLELRIEHSVVDRARSHRERIAELSLEVRQVNGDCLQHFAWRLTGVGSIDRAPELWRSEPESVNLRESVERTFALRVRRRQWPARCVMRCTQVL